MRENKKGFSEIVLILIIVVLVGVVGFFVYTKSGVEQNTLVETDKKTDVVVDIINACDPVDAPVVRFISPARKAGNIDYSTETTSWLNIKSLSDIKFNTVYSGEIVNNTDTIQIIFHKSDSGYLFGEYTLYKNGDEYEKKTFKSKTDLVPNKEVCG